MLNRFTCLTARTSLGLRLAHVVASMNPRLDSLWGGSFPLPGRELHPLEAPGLSWRTENELEFHQFCAKQGGSKNRGVLCSTQVQRGKAFKIRHFHGQDSMGHNFV
jgi:hypothetical protein